MFIDCVKNMTWSKTWDEIKGAYFFPLSFEIGICVGDFYFLRFLCSFTGINEIFAIETCQLPPLSILVEINELIIDNCP